MLAPELIPVLEFLKKYAISPDASPAERRLAQERKFAALPSLPGVIHQPVMAGIVPAEWIAVQDVAPERTILFLHGGGYISGAIAASRDVAARLCQACNGTALGIDYRLAPEHPFPAAVEDTVSSYRWLLSQGMDPTGCAIVGSSAGGGLALATLVSLREQGIQLPAAAVCFSPGVDLSNSGESFKTKADVDPILNSTMASRCAELYLRGTDPHHPLASPLFADLHGLPPLLIQVGTEEILLDDSRRLADRAQQAGVPVVLEVWGGMIHTWHDYVGILPQARAAVRRAGLFIQEQTRFAGE